MDRNDSGDSARRYTRGLEFLKQSHIEEAKEEFEYILLDEPGFAPAHFGLGCVHALKGLKDEAMEQWEKCLELDLQFGEAHYALSWVHYEAGDTDKGYEHLNRAIDSGVSREKVQEIIGIFPRIQPKPIEAQDGGLQEIDVEEHKKISIFETLSRKGGLDELYRRGLASLEDGRLDSAIELLEQAISLDPSRPEFHFSLGEAYSRKVELSQAIEEWRRTVELEPEHEEAHRKIAKVIQKIQRLDQPEHPGEIAPPGDETPGEIDSDLELYPLQGVEGISEKEEIHRILREITHRRELVYDLLGCSLIFLVCLILLRGTLREGYPRSFLDGTMAYYLAKVKMLLSDFTFYTESWYFGFELLRFYPPLSAIVPYVLAVLTGKPLLSYNYLSFLFYVLFCLGNYFFISRFLGSRPAGLFAGAIWAMTHSNVVSFQGHYWEIARLAGTAAVPWFLLSVDSAMRTGEKRWALTAVGLASYTLLTNMYSVYDLTLFSLPFLVVRGMFFPVEKRPVRYSVQNRTFKIMLVCLLGVLTFTFWWYLPSVLPYGTSGYTMGGRSVMPSLETVLLQLHPPDWMPATQLPLTIVGFLGVAVCLVRRDAYAPLLITWLILTVFSAYFMRVQSVRMLPLISLSLVFLGAYFVHGFVHVTPEISKRLTDVRRRDISTITSICAILLFLIPYMPLYSRYAIVDDGYLATDEFRTALWLKDQAGEDYRVYVMYGSNFRGAQWLNAFSPGTKQVLGGHDAGAIMVDTAPFIFDGIVKNGYDAGELHEIALGHSVRYIVIDTGYMRGLGPVYMKFFEDDFFTPVEDINKDLTDSKVFEVKGVEPLSETFSTYNYWDKWRILGMIGTFLLMPIFVTVYRRTELQAL